MDALADFETDLQRLPAVAEEAADEAGPDDRNGATLTKRRWVKQWVCQSTVLNNGKCFLFKWVTEDMVVPLPPPRPQLPLPPRLPEPTGGGTISSGVPSKKAEEISKPTTPQLFVCNVEGCGKAFMEPGALRKHAHVHGEKQFICHYEGCGKRFVDSSKLKRHFLIHTGEKSFVCPFEGCGKVRPQPCPTPPAPSSLSLIQISCSPGQWQG
eukprot:jgi/Mesen1/4996/ME000248S04281